MFEQNEQMKDELPYWLAFDQLHGIGLGSVKIRALYGHLESMRTAWTASDEVLQYVPGFDAKFREKFFAKRKEINPEKILEQLQKTSITAIPYADSRYPARLKEIHDPPTILYVNGSFSLDELTKAVAIVGTRNPSSYGQRLAKEISKGLSENGVTVVSGMALGIDSISHWGAMEGGSRTVAVLASGPDHCYPSSNKHLFNTILKEHKGFLVSEYFPGVLPEPFRFPARNRIISGLSVAVVVIEGGLSSGSLITADLAFQQNRDVFALPGRVDSPMSAGPHDLVVRRKAHIVRDHYDILNELAWDKNEAGPNARTKVELYGREKDVYEMLSIEPIHFDKLCERASMPAGEMSATLTMLELAGLVLRLPGDWYSLLAGQTEPVLPAG